MERCRITSIMHLNGDFRTDGRYPQRINSVVDIVSADVGSPMLLSYITDNEGNEKEGYLRTSIVAGKRFLENCSLFIVTTQNSIYYMKRET